MVGRICRKLVGFYHPQPTPTKSSATLHETFIVGHLDNSFCYRCYSVPHPCSCSPVLPARGGCAAWPPPRPPPATGWSQGAAPRTCSSGPAPAGGDILDTGTISPLLTCTLGPGAWHSAAGRHCCCWADSPPHSGPPWLGGGAEQLRPRLLGITSVGNIAIDLNRKYALVKMV